MSKPTHKQKEVICALQEILIYWESSNDIHSPSHESDVHDVIDAITRDDVLRPEAVLSEREAETVSGAILDLHAALASLSKCPLREAALKIMKQ